MTYETILIDGQRTQRNIDMAGAIANDITNGSVHMVQGKDGIFTTVKEALDVSRTGDSILYVPKPIPTRRQRRKHMQSAMKISRIQMLKEINLVIVTKDPSKELLRTCDYYLRPAYGAKVYRPTVSNIDMDIRNVRIGQWWHDDDHDKTRQSGILEALRNHIRDG